MPGGRDDLCSGAIANWSQQGGAWNKHREEFEEHDRAAAKPYASSLYQGGAWGDFEVKDGSRQDSGQGELTCLGRPGGLIEPTGVRDPDSERCLRLEMQPRVENNGRGQ